MTRYYRDYDRPTHIDIFKITDAGDIVMCGCSKNDHYSFSTKQLEPEEGNPYIKQISEDEYNRLKSIVNEHTMKLVALEKEFNATLSELKKEEQNPN